jgi:hypothetical protein
MVIKPLTSPGTLLPSKSSNPNVKAQYQWLIEPQKHEFSSLYNDKVTQC